MMARGISTVHRGNAFEERAVQMLKDNFSMSLKRVGGRGDGGIDLLGWWWLPNTTPGSATPDPNHSSYNAASVLGRRRIRVVGQCKAEKKKMGPKYVRELEGVMYRLMASARHPHPVQSNLPRLNPFPDAPGDAGTLKTVYGDLFSDSNLNEEPTVAVLVSQSPFTKATLLRAQSSPIPFLLLHLPSETINPSQADEPRLFESGALASEDPRATAVWNMALAGTDGVLRGQMEVRWERDLSPNGMDKPWLWWQSKRLGCCIPEGS